MLPLSEAIRPTRDFPEPRNGWCYDGCMNWLLANERQDTVGADLSRPIDIKLSLPHRLLAFGPDQRSAQQELGGVGRLLACIQATA